ncbi:MAG: hypothetical protein IT373_27455 [Polyangiaceae bacterium]|nr:hypothetical protein [Polyangiaceae bacterium]
MPRPTILFTVAALAGTTLAACQGKRIEECNALIGVINDEQQQVKPAQSQEPADFERVAERLAETARRVADVSLTVEALREHRDAYQALVNDIAEVMRGAAQALRDRDGKKLDAARTLERQVGEREDELVETINRYCAGG